MVCIFCDMIYDLNIVIKTVKKVFGQRLFMTFYIGHWKKCSCITATDIKIKSYF